VVGEGWIASTRCCDAAPFAHQAPIAESVRLHLNPVTLSWTVTPLSDSVQQQRAYNLPGAEINLLGAQRKTYSAGLNGVPPSPSLKWHHINMKKGMLNTPCTVAVVYSFSLTATLFGSAQEPAASAHSEPMQQSSQRLPAPTSARQQWNTLRLAQQFSRKAEQLEKQGKRDEAERMAERALALQEQIRGPVHLDVARGVDRLADLYTAHKKDSAAEPLYERAQAIRDVVLSTHPDVYDRDGSELKIHRNQPAEKAGAVLVLPR